MIKRIVSPGRPIILKCMNLIAVLQNLKKNPTELKREIEKLTILVGDFNLS